MAHESDEARNEPFAFMIHRRTLLRGGLLGGVGLAAAALIGCGGDDDDDDDGTAASPAVQATAGGGTATTTPADDTEDGEETAAAAPSGGITTPQGRFVPYNFPEPDVPPKFGGTLTHRFIFDPGPLDPAVAAAGGTQTAVNGIYNRLIGVYNKPDYDPFSINRLQPEIAESWETSPDGLSYTFHVRPDVTFHNVPPHNGRRLTSQDVQFTYNRYKDPGSVHRSNFAKVAAIEAPDDDTVVIRMSVPQPDFIYPLATPYSTIHSHELVDSGEMISKAVGTGPMILDHWTPGDGGAFDKNPDYWLDDVKIDRWELPLIRDLGAAEAQFRVGRLDYGMSASTSDDLEKILETNPDTQYFTGPLQTSTTALTFNMDLPRWQDVRIRRAISLAVDREELLDIIFSGLGVVMPQMDWRYFFDESPADNPALLGNYWRHAPDESKKLLEAAGATDLEFDIVFYNYSNTNNAFQNEVLREQLGRVGVTFNLRSVDYTEFNSQWTTRTGEADTYDGWTSFNPTAEHYVYGLNHSESSGNRNRIVDPQIDVWAEQHQVELDEEVRKDLAKNVWDRVRDQAYRVSKAAGYGFQLQQPWVRGVRYANTSVGSGHFYLDSGYEVTNAWIDK